MAAPKSNRPESVGRNPVPPLDSPAAKSSLAADASPSNPEVLCTLYSVMLKTRLLEEHALALLRVGRIPGASVPVLGGEATEVGACIGLQPDDAFSSSLPKLATHVVMNTPLPYVFAHLLNAEKKLPTIGLSSQLRKLQVIPQTATIAGQFAVAAGVAFAYRQHEKSNVVVALADDGLAALGCWHEAATVAAQQRLPIVFIVENGDQSHRNGTGVVKYDGDLRDRAEAYGFPGITVDGNDIVAVWRVTQESIHRARSGAGPTLIECRTWRWHAEADDNSARRFSSTRLMQARKAHDPLHHMEHYMKKRSLWQAAWKDQLITQYRAALGDAVASAKESSSTR